MSGVNKATGLSVEENTARSLMAKKVAPQIRKRHIQELIESTDPRRFAALHLKSKSKSDEAKYLVSIKLVDILSARPGVTQGMAQSMMANVGLKPDTTLRSIRVNSDTISLFEGLLNSSVDGFRARPQPPAGWPWSGKLSLLIASAGAPVPVELTGVVADDDDVLSLLDDDSEDAEADDDDSGFNAIFEDL